MNYKLKNKSGVALILTMFAIVSLLTLGSLFVMRTVTEKNVVMREMSEAKNLYLADGAGQASLDFLMELINNDLMSAINAKSPSGLISEVEGYVNAGDALGLLANNLSGLTVETDYIQYNSNTLIIDLERAYRYIITITESGPPVLSGSNAWTFPYYVSIEATGELTNGESKTIYIDGDFKVEVQKGSFARYALYTNHHTTTSGGYVWFTNNTNFTGPLHTNQRFSFAFNPSGVFDGLVTQEDTHARFYNGGYWYANLNDDHNGTTDVPTFNAGFDRGVSHVPLPSTSDKQAMIDQATGLGTYNAHGIHIPNNGSELTGGVYIKGNVDSIDLSVNGSDQAVYTIQQGSKTKTITVDHVNNTTSVNDGTTTVNYTGKPDGIDDGGTLIFVDGDLNAVGGIVQRDTKVTIGVDDDLVIQNNLMYSDYTAGSGTPGTVGYVAPTAYGTKNMLGLISWRGDVRIGTAAPDDVNIHATIMANDGVFTVDSYDDYGIGPRGHATLLGGVITDYYGAFGKFNGSTGSQLSGYGRNYVYDERMLTDSPAYYPTLEKFVAFTNDLTDTLVWRE